MLIFVITFQVSRSWYEVISSCEQYWKLQCKQSGVFRDLDLLQKEMLEFGSFWALFSALFKFKARLRPQLLSLTERKLDGSDIYWTHIPNGCYHSCPFSVNASISVYNASFESSEQVSHCEVGDIFPHGYPSVEWSFPINDGALLCTNNGKWVRFIFPGGNLSPSSFTWEEDEIRSFVYDVPGSCPNCSLVVIVSKVQNDESLWELEALQLKKGHKEVITIRTKFPFFPSDIDSATASEDWNPFCAHRVFLLPQCPSSSDSCLMTSECKYTKHWLLIQFGYLVVIFELIISNFQCSVSTPFKIWYPTGQPEGFLFSSATKCLLSKDYTLVALCKTKDMREVHLWNRESGREYKVVTPNLSGTSRWFPSSETSECLAVGHLFTIISRYIYSPAGLPIIYIMSTVSGNVFHECDLNVVNVPLASKLQHCYKQEAKFSTFEGLLLLFEMSPCQLWLDTLRYTDPQCLCLIGNPGPRHNCIVTFTF